MTWHDLLFIHWPIPARLIRPFIPPPLELDLFDGYAWIGVVPFYMTGVRPRGLRLGARLENFPEINVRTYATFEGTPGVWFLSLDTPNILANAAARSFYHLPYRFSKIVYSLDRERISYRSKRGLIEPTAEFIGTYEPIGAVEQSQPGTLAFWLTERYCLYCADRGSVYRGQVIHDRWLLRPAEVEIVTNTMLSPVGLGPRANKPLLHFSKRLDVVAKPLVRIAERE